MGVNMQNKIHNKIAEHKLMKMHGFIERPMIDVIILNKQKELIEYQHSTFHPFGFNLSVKK